jgi:hypothetical protein
MRRRGGTPPKKYGTPTVFPEPQAIDPASGFKVPLKNLVRQWDNQLVDYRYVDKRNPQDFVRGVKDNMALPYSRPEQPNQYIAGNIIWQNPTEQQVELLDQDGDMLEQQDSSPILSQSTVPLGPSSEIIMTTQTGNALLDQGEVPSL